MMTPAIIMNQSADYWHYKIGCNVIKANTKVKETYENWSQWQDQSIPDQLHEERKQNGYYSNGLAIIPGKIWRGPYTGKNLVAIDLDNRKAIEEFCKDGLDDLKQQTLVEQTSNPDKMHIYFIVDREIPNKSSDKTNTDTFEKINENEIPALEVKSNGKGIMFCSDSPHKNGSNYRIIGTLTPKVFDAQVVEDRIGGICDKYNIPYGFDNNNKGNSIGYQTPIEDLWKAETKILEGHNRHLELLRIMESELQINKGRKSLEDIKQIVHFWNQKHCNPPLDDIEFEKQWKQAIKFVSKSSINDNNNNTNQFNGNGHNSNKHESNNKSQKIESIIIELEKRRTNYFEFVVSSIKKTVKCEDALIRQVLYTGLSTYVEDDPINLGILAPTSEGKTYAVTEPLQYFPSDDVLYIGQMSPKVLVRQKGTLIDKETGKPIHGKVQELRTKTRELEKKKRAIKDRDKIADINEEIDQVGEDIRKLYENSKTLIDLRGKILVFLEPPQHELWNLLKPILSHDKKEIEFPFVDKTPNSNAETKDVVVRGWPSCIFCSAKDESKWEIWNEIKSRILVTSPNMVAKKYQESNKLISQSKGLPNLIQQQIIISDEEIEDTKNCVLLIKQKIQELKSQNKYGKISLWIPYYDLLQKELPANKGTDVRFAKKVFSLLNIVAIVKSDSRMVLMLEDEKSIIVNLQDLREVLSITQNFDGLPKFKAEFFNDIFYPCFAKKTEPDSKKNDKGETVKEEEVRAVTTRELCDYYKESNNKPISTDNLKHTYLNQLINEGLIDYTNSKIDTRQNIYYPLVTEKISITSITDPLDNYLPNSLPIYERIITNITENWISNEITGLARYRLDQGTIEDIEDYVNDPEKMQILDSYSIFEQEEKQQEGSTIRTLSISEFTAKYSGISSTSIDIQRSKN
jgi:hypothetical protein